MARNLSYYAFIISLVSLLSGCTSYKEQSCTPVKKTQINTDQIVSTVQSVPSAPSVLELTNNQNQFRQVRHYDWFNTINPLIYKMLQTYDITSTSTLLVYTLNNQTNGYINTREVTDILRSILVNSGKFILIPTKQLYEIKQQLGLSLEDRLNSRGKAVGIARNIKAQYVLYSRASGNIDFPFLQIQLILVKTGEIIWSGTSIITQF